MNYAQNRDFVRRAHQYISPTRSSDRAKKPTLNQRLEYFAGERFGDPGGIAQWFGLEAVGDILGIKLRQRSNRVFASF